VSNTILRAPFWRGALKPMPNFLENTFAQLQQASGRVVLREIRGTEFVSVSGAELLEQVARARAYLRGAGLQTGDRCALLGPNSIRWPPIDLALNGRERHRRPLYSRQAPPELAAMIGLHPSPADWRVTPLRARVLASLARSPAPRHVRRSSPIRSGAKGNCRSAESAPERRLSSPSFTPQELPANPRASA